MGRGGQGYNASNIVLKSMKMSEGCVKNLPKLRDVIYGQPLCALHKIAKIFFHYCYLLGFTSCS